MLILSNLHWFFQHLQWIWMQKPLILQTVDQCDSWGAAVRDANSVTSKHISYGSVWIHLNLPATTYVYIYYYLLKSPHTTLMSSNMFYPSCKVYYYDYYYYYKSYYWLHLGKCIQVCVCVQSRHCGSTPILKQNWCPWLIYNSHTVVKWDLACVNLLGSCKNGFPNMTAVKIIHSWDCCDLKLWNKKEKKHHPSVAPYLCVCVYICLGFILTYTYAAFLTLMSAANLVFE